MNDKMRLVFRLMAWCRAGIRRDFLKVYTSLFYKPLTFENHQNRMHYTMKQSTFIFQYLTILGSVYS